jgi:cation diffusion facilitator CzcD-associated flavoprotein CzcO
MQPLVGTGNGLTAAVVGGGIGGLAAAAALRRAGIDALV